MATKKTETKVNGNRLSIVGTMTYVSRGINKKFDKNNTKEVTTISIIPSNDILSALKDVYKDTGKKFTPAYVLGESEYFNLHSEFEVPVFRAGKKIEDDIIDIVDEKPIKNAKVEIICKVKEGAIYPLGVNVRAWGEMITSGVSADDFEAVTEDEELPFE